MLKCFKKINKKETGVLQQVFYSEQQVLNCFQAKMPRSFTQTVQQLFCVQRNVY